MRDKFFPIMQQVSESTASFMICIEQEYIYQGLDITTTYYAFLSKLDITMQALLDNVQVNISAKSGGSLIWADVVETSYQG